jgi:hypothetical protein
MPQHNAAASKSPEVADEAKAIPLAKSSTEQMRRRRYRWRASTTGGKMKTAQKIIE